VRVSADASFSLDSFHLDGPNGRLYALLLSPPPGVATELSVLVCPPFAEEQNRTRRAVQLAARRIARHGCRVLLLDLHGTGDSEGEFGQARWEGWRADLEAGAAWLRARGSARLAVWGIRLGAALALELASSRACEHILLWQPVTKGALYLNQFLRLRVAADMLAADGVSSVDALRAELAAGRSVEIAGYEIAPALADAIAAVDLDAYAGRRMPPIDWLEAVAAPDRPLSPASRSLIERWQQSGLEVHARAAVAQPFWGTPEIVVPESFLDASDEIARDWTREAVTA
jgi:exosortase A-associated hydrolase 2